MMPKFSIIIPVYNVAPYLRECLDSVLAQTFTDWEAICVDDGSTDDSGAILDEYAANDSRFHVTHQANAGVSAARNVALDVARGEWLAFADGDDRIETGWLAHIADVISRYSDVAIVRTGWTWWGDGRSLVRRSQLDDIERYVESGAQSAELYWELISGCAYPFINVVRRNAFEKIRFPVGVRFREDALYEYAIASHGLPLVVIKECGYLHRDRSDSAMHCRRRADTVNLLSGYLPIWRSSVFRTQSCVASSTRWIAKDVWEWVVHCSDRTMVDSFRVWLCIWKLMASGAFSVRCCEDAKKRLRWRFFLLTGWAGALNFTFRH